MNMRANDKLNVLFVTSEVAPLIKTGGLADVSVACRRRWRALGVDIRVLVPGYPQVIERSRPKPRGDAAGIAGRSRPRICSLRNCRRMCRCWSSIAAIYDRRGGPYQDAAATDWQDNDLRFGLLSYVGALLSTPGSPFSAWRPDIVHCNDWQTGLTPAYLNYVHGRRGRAPS